MCLNIPWIKNCPRRPLAPWEAVAYSHHLWSQDGSGGARPAKQERLTQAVPALSPGGLARLASHPAVYQPR
eukprot:6352162-Pyramimonas_sp.AAC.1